MANIKNYFSRGRMNKDVDERMLPAGEYLDAMNIRVGNADLSGDGVVKKAKGNKVLTELKYKGTSLSSDALCVGAVADEERNSIVFCVHDNNFPTGTSIVDMICSFNTDTSVLTYNIVSASSGIGIPTTLNFSENHLVNGMNIVDDLCFITDNYNPPRVFNLQRNLVV